MKGVLSSIKYTKVIKKNRKHIILKLKDGSIETLLSYWIELDKKEKTAILPEWYAKKQGLI